MSGSNISSSSKGPPASFSYRAFILIVLLLIYILNFADRVVIGILAVPIKLDLGLSDTELGLLGGTAFALFYSIFGIPIALLADRFSRVKIIALALIVWSGFTAMCGMATGFVHLFLFRLGVGIGEAGGVAPSYSLISDYFPPQQRARALGFFSFGIPIGGAVGLLLGGVIATQINWRLAFFVLGAAGFVVAPIFLWLAKEPVRGQFEVNTPVAAHELREVISILRRKPAFWFLSVGVAVANMAAYGISFWLPSFLIRVHGLTLIEASEFYAAILLTGGLAGIWLGAYFVDRYGAGRPRLYILVPLITLLGGIPFFIGALLTSSMPLAFALFLIVTALGNSNLGPVLTAVQQMVEPNMRATASAVLLFVNNLIGLGLGALVLGMISDAFIANFGTNSLRYALLAIIVFQLIGAVLLYISSRFIEQDWER